MRGRSFPYRKTIEDIEFEQGIDPSKPTFTEPSTPPNDIEDAEVVEAPKRDRTN